MIDVLGRVGFRDVALRERFDPFRDTTKGEYCSKVWCSRSECIR
jgi:hypothetical protein